MTVFRTYLKVMNRCKMPIIVYTVILLVFSWFHISMGDDPTDFVSEKPDIYVKNLGGETEFTEHLTSYLEKYFVIDDIKDEGDGINDALFYRDVNYVIFIPADYSTRIIEGNEPEVSVKSVGNYAASYAGMILEEYLQTVDKCMSVSQPGSSINEALDKTDKILGTDSKVEVTGSLDMNRMQMAADYYNFANYSIMAGCICVICIVYSSFRQRNVLSRINVSGMGYKKHNAMVILANAVFTCAFWAFYVILGIVLLGKVMFSMNGLMFAVNTFIFSFCALTIGLLIGALLSGRDAINSVVNVVALGSSFLCGSFVRQDMLPDFVLKIGHALPSYWFINTNEIIKKTERCTVEIVEKMAVNWSALLAFSVLFLICFNIITKPDRI